MCQYERWKVFKASMDAKNDETVTGLIKHIEEEEEYLDVRILEVEKGKKKLHTQKKV